MSEVIVKAHEVGNKLLLSYHQDVEDHLRVAHEERRCYGGLERKAEFRKTMTLPFNVIMKVCQDTGLDFFNPGDAKEILKILKRPEYKGFRTVPDKRI